MCDGEVVLAKSTAPYASCGIYSCLALIRADIGSITRNDRVEAHFGTRRSPFWADWGHVVCDLGLDKTIPLLAVLRKGSFMIAGTFGSVAKILDFGEVWRKVFVVPPCIPKSFPVIVFRGRGFDPDMVVDRTRASHDLATRPGYDPVVCVCLRTRLSGEVRQVPD